MMKQQLLIIALLFISCKDFKEPLNKRNFYGNQIEIPKLFIDNVNKQKQKDYCKNNIYLTDTLVSIIYEARLCRYPYTDNSDFDFKYLKKVFEGEIKEIKMELPEIENIKIESINRENYFLFRNVRKLNNTYQRKTYIAFKNYFVYLYFSSPVENYKIIEKSKEVDSQFENFKNFEVFNETGICNYCRKVLFN